MRFKNIGAIVTLTIALIVSVHSCKKVDDNYKQFLEGGERVYVGRADSIKTYGGQNRIMLEWLLISDPKVTGYKVFWNNGRDSISNPVQKINVIDTVRLMINNIPEGAYFFDIYTYDNEGHRSVKATAYGRVYGSNYQKSLLARGVKSSTPYDAYGTVRLTWSDPDEQFVGGQVRYTTFYGNDTIIPIVNHKDSIYTLLPNATTTFQYRSIFKPQPAAIDSFYSSWTTQTTPVKVTGLYMKNFEEPFVRAAWDGARWGTLKEWMVNAAAKNRGIYGSYDKYQNGEWFGFERWVAADKTIVNGKAYQTVKLPKGKYAFFIYRNAVTGNANGGNDQRYIVVAGGNTLPDINNISTAIASKSFVGLAENGTTSVEFTLDKPTEVSLGVVLSFTSTSQNMRMAEVGILQMPE